MVTMGELMIGQILFLFDTIEVHSIPIPVQ